MQTKTLKLIEYAQRRALQSPKISIPGQLPLKKPAIAGKDGGARTQAEAIAQGHVFPLDEKVC